MPKFQSLHGRHPVHVALQCGAPSGFLAHAAQRLFHHTEQPFLVELGAEMAAKARRIAIGAPPHVLYPMVASIQLPRPVALIELPAREALYAEREEGRLYVCVLRTNGDEVTFQPVLGVLQLPSERPAVNWEAVDMEAWGTDLAADAGWAAWAGECIEAAPPIGVPPATGAERERLLRAYVLPSLVALALVTSPLAEAEPTVWVTTSAVDEG